MYAQVSALGWDGKGRRLSTLTQGDTGGGVMGAYSLSSRPSSLAAMGWAGDSASGDSASSASEPAMGPLGELVQSLGPNLVLVPKGGALGYIVGANETHYVVAGEDDKQAGALTFVWRPIGEDPTAATLAGIVDSR
jgi:hypothetical protein